MKKVQSLEETGLLLKAISKTIKNEAKEQKGGFLPMLLGSALKRRWIIRAGERRIWTCENFWCGPSFN